jgi:hypothetical protein
MNPILRPEYKLRAFILISKVSSSVSRLFVSARLSLAFHISDIFLLP